MKQGFHAGYQKMSLYLWFRITQNCTSKGWKSNSNNSISTVITAACNYSTLSLILSDSKVVVPQGPLLPPPPWVFACLACWHLWLLIWLFDQSISGTWGFHHGLPWIYSSDGTWFWSTNATLNNTYVERRHVLPYTYCLNGRVIMLQQHIIDWFA